MAKQSQLNQVWKAVALMLESGGVDPRDLENQDVQGWLVNRKAFVGVLDALGVPHLSKLHQSIDDGERKGGRL